ncbi:AN1-type zinc finger protein 5 [Porphyridium purpureum]|uniref:AN1-type zinc finger protein 5 n=1 Tax=Porphyridium purpureum TaxID=35688 RepID=A0A5J4YQD0_PORPP|nr:AN1-type zinc finger protein 5 [Porphyridium purpureum]|eukprot:POR9048..scf222_8
MMDEKADSGSVQKAVPVLCAQGCGFYGSSTTLNMCSKCFRDTQKVNQQVAEAPSPGAAGAAKELESSVAAAMSIVQNAAAEAENAAAAAAGAASAANVGSPAPTAPSSAAFGAPMVPRLESVVLSTLNTPLKPRGESLAEPSAPQTPMANLAASVSSQAAGISLSAPSEDDLVAAAAADSGETVAVAPTTAVPGSPKRKIQKNTGRCWECRKKVGLLGFKCRCDYTYCGEHRYTDKHACDFDYKTLAKQNLEKANPQVVASKLEKI